ncbi:MAG: uracil-DNA glycosylase [Bacteroidales bacterium]|nr:uracil-DNA glycosylase [Bacteroidales bacterium]
MESSQPQNLESLRPAILNCTLCGLARTRNHVIFGEGNPNAGIMLIGEAPGRDEDIQGRPFVGLSGQLLDKILAACGFTRNEHVFISNIVKCRPPGNRLPSTDEASLCMPWLLMQIEMINPKIMILLGATALKYMAGSDYRITKDHGKWISISDRLAIPVYHPAALLRDPSLKRDTWEDFKIIFHKYRELVDPNHHSPNIK